MFSSSERQKMRMIFLIVHLFCLSTDRTSGRKENDQRSNNDTNSELNEAQDVSNQTSVVNEVQQSTLVDII